MIQQNLSEILFKPKFKHPETSTLVRHTSDHQPKNIHSVLDGKTISHWYRMINRVMWAWRGLNLIETEQILARIAKSVAEHSNNDLLDTVIGYRNGNWTYEWVHRAMYWQQKALEKPDLLNNAGQYWLNAANFYSIAGYPHIKGDELAEQAEVLSNRAYEETAKFLPYELKKLDFVIQDGGTVTGFLHLPVTGNGPFPTVLVCGGLDTLQSDYHRLFRDYLSPVGVAMLTIDMPSVGFSSHWKLTQDSSYLHQQVLQALPTIPWIDHQRVTIVGFRFGANVAVRLGYLEPQRLRGVACLGPVVHSLLCDRECQKRVPNMYVDVLASRLGMPDVSDDVLKAELNRYSLKKQGLLGRRCQTPMLAGYWKNDVFSPKEDAQLIASSSVDGKLIVIPSTPIYHSFDHALLKICDWLRAKMC